MSQKKITPPQAQALIEILGVDRITELVEKIVTETAFSAMNATRTELHTAVDNLLESSEATIIAKVLEELGIE